MILTWRGSDGEGWYWVKRDGYFSKNFLAVFRRSKWDLRREREEIDKYFEGEEMIWFLKKMTCLRSFSLETVVSRYGSRTHLTLAAMKLRRW